MFPNIALWLLSWWSNRHHRVDSSTTSILEVSILPLWSVVPTPIPNITSGWEGNGEKLRSSAMWIVLPILHAIRHFARVSCSPFFWHIQIPRIWGAADRERLSREWDGPGQLRILTMDSRICYSSHKKLGRSAFAVCHSPNQREDINSKFITTSRYQYWGTRT